MKNKQEIITRRLHNQRLSETAFQIAREVVSWMGAMQAQDYAGAKWAIAQRATGLTDAMLDQALAEGTILRTHVLRPTWHFVAPEDIRWMLKLTAPRVNALNAYQYRRYELDDAIFKRSNAALTNALRDGKQLTREELAVVLAKAKIGKLDNLRMAHLMMRAELDAVVVSGARRGKQFTYALLDERAEAGPDFTPEEALAELTRRYLRSRGPAAAADFCWWSGLTLTEARRGFAAVQSEFEHATFEGETYLFPAVPASNKAGIPSQASAHWLATYDEYLIGYKDRSAAVEPELAQQIIGGEVFISTCLSNGKVIATWKRTLSKKEVLIELTLMAAIKAAEKRALLKAADHFGNFLGLPVRLVEL